MKQYEDILYLPHPTSKKRPRMSMMNRAAQFAPFSALTGYDKAIKDTAREMELKAEETGRESEEFF